MLALARKQLNHAFHCASLGLYGEQNAKYLRSEHLKQFLPMDLRRKICERKGSESQVYQILTKT